VRRGGSRSCRALRAAEGRVASPRRGDRGTARARARRRVRIGHLARQEKVHIDRADEHATYDALMRLERTQAQGVEILPPPPQPDDTGGPGCRTTNFTQPTEATSARSGSLSG